MFFLFLLVITLRIESKAEEIVKDNNIFNFMFKKAKAKTGLM